MFMGSRDFVSPSPNPNANAAYGAYNLNAAESNKWKNVSVTALFHVNMNIIKDIFFFLHVSLL